MNKVFLGLILAVCILGMALVMLNERLGRKQEAPIPTQTAERPLSTTRIPTIVTEDREYAMAESALNPPIREALPERPKPAELPRIEEETPVLPEPEMPKYAPEQAASPEASIPAPVPSSPASSAPVPPAPKPVPPTEAPRAPAAQKAETPKTPAANAAKAVTRFVIYARDKGATVRVGGNGKVDYTSMTLEDPNRVVLDLNGEWKFPANPGIPKNDLVSAVRVGKNGDKTRVVIDLKMKPRKVVLVPFKSGDGVDVRVDK